MKTQIKHTVYCACYAAAVITTILVLMATLQKCRGDKLPKLEFCEATYYSSWHDGMITANGQIYRDADFSCASAYREDLGKDLIIHYNGEAILLPCNDMLTNPKALKRGARIDLSQAAVKELTGGKLMSIDVIIERVEDYEDN